MLAFGNILSMLSIVQSFCGQAQKQQVFSLGKVTKTLTVKMAEQSMLHLADLTMANYPAEIEPAAYGQSKIVHFTTLVLRMERPG